jgi:SAM-dependent methyltransferase
VWGIDRGKIIDRYYIEAFLTEHRADIRGRVLDVKDSFYGVTYGSDAVTRVDVLDIDPSNSEATVVADLTKADEVPTGTFDCFLLLQTLHIIYDVRGALFHAHRILKPGGVLLCTLPAVSRVNCEGAALEGGDYWRFTEASVRELFSELFPLEDFEVHAFGNVMTDAGFLYGLSTQDLPPEALEFNDPWFPLVFCVRAVKAPAPAAAKT